MPSRSCRGLTPGRPEPLRRRTLSLRSTTRASTGVGVVGQFELEVVDDSANFVGEGVDGVGAGVADHGSFVRFSMSVEAGDQACGERCRHFGKADGGASFDVGDEWCECVGDEVPGGVGFVHVPTSNSSDSGSELLDGDRFQCCLDRLSDFVDVDVAERRACEAFGVVAEFGVGVEQVVENVAVLVSDQGGECSAGRQSAGQMR